jgi:hypothetical protein
MQILLSIDTPFCVESWFNTIAAGDARVVDTDIQRAESALDVIEHCPNLFGIRNVNWNR